MPDFQCSVSGCEDYDVEWAARVRKGPLPPAGPPPEHMLRPIGQKSYGTAAPAEPPLGHMRGTAGPAEAVGRKKSYGTTAPAEPPRPRWWKQLVGRYTVRSPPGPQSAVPPAGPVTPPAGPAEAAGPKKSYGTTAPAEPPRGQRSYGNAAPAGPPCGHQSYGTAAPVTSPDRRLARSRSPRRSSQDIPEWCQERLKVAAVLAASDSNLRHYSTDSLILELYRRTFQP